MVLAINTRCLQVHGYTPAEILLGFNPSLTRKLGAGLEEFVKRDLVTVKIDASVWADELSFHGYIDSCEESSLQAGMWLAEKQDQLQARKTPGY